MTQIKSSCPCKAAVLRLRSGKDPQPVPLGGCSLPSRSRPGTALGTSVDKVLNLSVPPDASLEAQWIQAHGLTRASQAKEGRTTQWLSVLTLNNSQRLPASPCAPVLCSLVQGRDGMVVISKSPLGESDVGPRLKTEPASLVIVGLQSVSPGQCRPAEFRADGNDLLCQPPVATCNKPERGSCTRI